MSKKRGLKTLGDCKKFMSEIILKVKNGEMDATTGSKLAYMVNVQRGLIEGGLEELVEQLEEQQK
jgi:hypothetical protein